jgi:phospholipid-translocating ATPase
MVHTIEEFFPESGILDSNGNVNIPTTPLDADSHDRPSMLHRVDTGISSIVGSHNGERPGGFVLVVDGTALGYVGWILWHRR